MKYRPLHRYSGGSGALGFREINLRSKIETYGGQMARSRLLGIALNEMGRCQDQPLLPVGAQTDIDASANAITRLSEGSFFDSDDVSVFFPSLMGHGFQMSVLLGILPRLDDGCLDWHHAAKRQQKALE